MNDRIIYTIGHSDNSIEGFISLLKQHGITAVADVRSAPYSRFHPHFNKDSLSSSLEKENIAYVFLGKELGARPDDSACYENGRVDFERLAERAEFKIGLERILKGSEKPLCVRKRSLWVAIGRFLHAKVRQFMISHHNGFPPDWKPLCAEKLNHQSALLRLLNFFPFHHELIKT